MAVSRLDPSGQPISPPAGETVGSREPFSRAEIIAVGSELLVPPRVDTNSLLITEILDGLGIPVVSKSIVGDRVDDVAQHVRQALDRADLVVMTGGLGPTDDDVTRDAVARVLDLPMTEDPAIVERLRARFRSRGLTMPEINRRQAMVLAGARVLRNAQGTAPGQWIEVGERAVALLPGPPRELAPMLRDLAEGPLGARASALRMGRRTVFITGRSESHAEEPLQPCYGQWRDRPVPVEATILAAMGQLELHLSARGMPDEVAAALDAAVLDVQHVIGEDVFSVEGRPLEEVVGGLLLERGWTIALAESCTGGLATARLTDVPGSSAYVDRSIVVYSNAAKTELADVPAELIAQHGAVSEPVAIALATGIRRRAAVDIGVGITGIAGPGGGSEAKPVGTVAIAVAGPDDEPWVRSFRFPGERTRVKFFASQAALDMVRRVALRSLRHIS